MGTLTYSNTQSHVGNTVYMEKSSLSTHPPMVNMLRERQEGACTANMDVAFCDSAMDEQRL